MAISRTRSKTQLLTSVAHELNLLGQGDTDITDWRATIINTRIDEVLVMYDEKGKLNFDIDDANAIDTKFFLPLVYVIAASLTSVFPISELKYTNLLNLAERAKEDIENLSKMSLSAATEPTEPVSRSRTKITLRKKIARILGLLKDGDVEVAAHIASDIDNEVNSVLVELQERGLLNFDIDDNDAIDTKYFNSISFITAYNLTALYDVSKDKRESLVGLYSVSYDILKRLSKLDDTSGETSITPRMY